MPVTQQLVTVESSAGRGREAGLQMQYEDETLNILASAWEESLIGCYLIPHKTVQLSYLVRWAIEQKPSANVTPMPMTIEFTDLTATPDEPAWLSNRFMWRYGYVKRGDATQKMKQHFLSGGRMMTRDVWREAVSLMQGKEQLLWNSEYNTTQTAPEFAGLGMNPAGTATRPIASAKWSTDIPFTTTRMGFRDISGAPYSEAELITQTDNIHSVSGVSSFDVIMGSVNYGRTDNWASPRERYQWNGGTMKSSRNLQEFHLPAGVARIHVAWSNFPQQAVLAGHFSKKTICTMTPAGYGFRRHIQPRPGNLDAMALEVVDSVAPIVPHAFEWTYNTAAS